MNYFIVSLGICIGIQSTCIQGVKELTVDPASKRVTQEKEAKKENENYGELDAWALPDKRLRLDQIAFLGANNAHVNKQEGFIRAQQEWGLETQLQKGIRHFIFEIGLSTNGKTKGQLFLCHGECDTISVAARKGKRNIPLKTYFQIIKKFLNANPQEVVTLEFKNDEAINNKIYSVIRSVPGLMQYIMTPKNYNPLRDKGKWPTLQWLIANNKRLIIFGAGSVSKYGFNANELLLQNVYGTRDIDKVCTLRGKKSSYKTLWQLNYFGTETAPISVQNTPDILKVVLKHCQKKRFVSKDKSPNFIVLNYVDQGNAMKWINQLNQKAAQQLDK